MLYNRIRKLRQENTTTRPSSDQLTLIPLVCVQPAFHPFGLHALTLVSPSHNLFPLQLNLPPSDIFDFRSKFISSSLVQIKYFCILKNFLLQRYALLIFKERSCFLQTKSILRPPNIVYYFIQFMLAKNKIMAD